MFNANRVQRPAASAVLGGLLVVVGIALFLLVFYAVFPTIRDPVATYDRWFPTAPEQTVAAAEVRPAARFVWETLTDATSDPPVYRVRLEEDVQLGAGRLTSLTWDLGDGSVTTGRRITHEYASPGNYLVQLTMEDETGATAASHGVVSVRRTAPTRGAVGAIEGLPDLDGLDLSRLGVDGSAIGGQGLDGLAENGLGLDGLGDSVGSIGDSLTGTLDSAVGTASATARGGAVVALFALAALAGTIVAWRVARIGAMILVGVDARGAIQQRPDPTPEFEELRLVDPHH